MSTTVRDFRSRASKPPTNENPPHPSSKLQPTNPNPLPKRALGDITNLASTADPTQNANGPFKAVHPTKLRRPVTKNTSTSAAARRAKAAALAVAATKSASPMSTSTLGTRRASGRLAKRAAHSAMLHAKAVNRMTAVPCKLNFVSVAMDESDSSDEAAEPWVGMGCPLDVVDIDDADLDDELAAAIFAKEVHANWTISETRFMADAEYMARQSDISVKMRAILVDWLIDVHLKFKLQPETLHLTVNIIDRFLARRMVQRRKLQLVGITAMLIASKYQEIYAPEVADFVYISDKAYPKEEILGMEAAILNALKFEVTVPSGLTFLQRCVKAVKAELGADHFENEVVHLGHMAHYLIELGLQNIGMLRFRPSLRAASACWLAAKLIQLDLEWTSSMVFYSGGWEEDDLAACEQEFVRILGLERDGGASNKLTAVKRKFGVATYSCVSRMVGDAMHLVENTGMEM